MQPWVRIVPVEETQPDKSYFIARGHGPDPENPTGLDFWSRMKNGKTKFTSKPGIAIQYAGGPALVADFQRNASSKLLAVEVPEDAAKRWNKR